MAIMIQDLLYVLYAQQFALNALPLLAVKTVQPIYIDYLQVINVVV